MKPLINGRAYDWANIVVRLSNGTIPLVGITKITYEDEEEVENIYGAGKFPVSQGSGNYTATASITLPVEEIIKIQRTTGSKRLQDVPYFDITVSYLHPQADKQINDTIKNCRFTKNSRDLNQNDKTFPIELALVVSHIEWDNSDVLGLTGEQFI